MQRRPYNEYWMKLYIALCLNIIRMFDNWSHACMLLVVGGMNDPFGLISCFECLLSLLNDNINFDQINL